LFI
ncbi:GTPase Der, partial [Haemophilus influenzae]|jgi:hypothetical protein